MPKITNLDQRVELIAADVEDIKANGLGPEPVDVYTKTEADLKFQTIAGMSSYQTTAGMSSYLTTASAAETYQPIGSYLTASDISDMATQTWVGLQGFLTSSDVDEVPSVGSGDNGKVLTAVYNDGVASYSWETPSSTAHNQASDTINAMTGYAKAQADSAIATSDTLNAAVGKLEYKADVNKTNISSLAEHFTFSANSGHYYLQPEQPQNPEDGDIWIG